MKFFHDGRGLVDRHPTHPPIALVCAWLNAQMMLLSVPLYLIAFVPVPVVAVGSSRTDCDHSIAAFGAKRARRVGERCGTQFDICQPENEEFGTLPEVASNRRPWSAEVATVAGRSAIAAGSARQRIGATVRTHDGAAWCLLFGVICVGSGSILASCCC